MALVGFLSDFGLKDNFVGIVKAVILRINPSVQIIDITHQIRPYDILEAGFILKSSFKFFPKGTIFLAIVDPGVGSKRKAIIVKTKDFYFVSPDNGLLSLVLKELPPLKIIEISNDKYFLKPVSFTFQARDIFAPVVGYLSKGEKVDNFGKEVFTYRKLDFPPLKLNKEILEGEIIYVDHFGNLITNIDEKTFKDFTKNKRFKIQIGKFLIDKLSLNYAEAENLRPIVLINSFGYLEISLKEKNASEILKSKKADKVKIKIL
jgi:S-adenosylmethionine hydrolase